VGFYRKKPVVIEAMRLEWATWNEMCNFAGVGKVADGKPEGCYLDEQGLVIPDDGSDGHDRIGLLIPTLEGLMVARGGDWVIRGVKGELSPCRNDVFAQTYEEVT